MSKIEKDKTSSDLVVEIRKDSTEKNKTLILIEWDTPSYEKPAVYTSYVTPEIAAIYKNRIGKQSKFEMQIKKIHE